MCLVFHAILAHAHLLNHYQHQVKKCPTTADVSIVLLIYSHTLRLPSLHPGKHHPAFHLCNSVVIQRGSYVCVLQRLTFLFTQFNILEISSSSCMYQELIPAAEQCYRVWIYHHLFNHFTYWGAFWWFSGFGYYKQNCLLLSTCLHCYVWNNFL